MNPKYLWAVLLAMSAAVTPLLLAMGEQSPSSPKSASRSAKTRSAAQAGDEGQHVFEQNCARCHNAPEGFSPRISGTIVRHMRVRASLSEHDEKVLRSFFNP